jgi:hypothetical protein
MMMIMIMTKTTWTRRGGGYRTPSSAVRGLGQGFEKLSVNAASASRNRRTPPQSTTPRAVGRHSGANNGTNVPTES